MELTFRPIDVWPEGWRDENRDKTRQPTPFRNTYGDTLRDLTDELGAHNATHTHVQIAMAGADLRRDGMPRAHAKATHPGVILTVVTPARSIVLGTDRFYAAWQGQGEDWHHNLRAGTLGLRDLRRMERYGLNGGDAQYAGFAALGAGGPVALGSGMTIEQAAEFIAQWADTNPVNLPRVAAEIIEKPAVRKTLGRQAASRLHPDAGGDPALFQRLTEARNLLAGLGV